MCVKNNEWGLISWLIFGTWVVAIGMSVVLFIMDSPQFCAMTALVVGLGAHLRFKDGV